MKWFIAAPTAAEQSRACMRVIDPWGKVNKICSEIERVDKVESERKKILCGLYRQVCISFTADLLRKC